MSSGSFVEFLQEQLTLLGRVTVRRMFGSIGVFRDGLMFGIVADDTFYIRVDDRSLTTLGQAVSTPPFRYRRQGRIIDLPYRQVPEWLLDEPEELAVWARAALDAARRAASGNKRRKPVR